MSSYSVSATISDSTNSASTGTGALKVAGGVGIVGNCYAGTLRTFSGSTPISAAGTYNISLPTFCAGRISCAIDPIANGLWAASGDFLSTNNNVRVHLANIIVYQFANGGIQATLQPFGGANTNQVSNDSNQVQVVVSSIGSATTLRWSYTIFHT